MNKQVEIDTGRLPAGYWTLVEAAVSIDVTPLDLDKLFEKPDAYIYVTINIDAYRAGETQFAYIGSRELPSWAVNVRSDPYHGSGWDLPQDAHVH